MKGNGNSASCWCGHKTIERNVDSCQNRGQFKSLCYDLMGTIRNTRKTTKSVKQKYFLTVVSICGVEQNSTGTSSPIKSLNMTRYVRI